jgi:O-antigen ligase
VSSSAAVIDVQPSGGLRSSWALSALRFCAFLVVAGAVTSPPLANTAAALCVILFVLLPDRLARVRLLSGQPMLRALAVLGGVLVAATLHTVLLGGGLRVAADGLWGWRHLLLVPVIAAAFAEVAPRRTFLLSFGAFASVAAALLLVLPAIPKVREAIPLLSDQSALLFRNTVTQALLLALGAMCGIVVALTTISSSIQQRLAYMFGAAVSLWALIGHQIGRSGLVAFIVMAAVAALWGVGGRKAWALVVCMLALAVIAVIYSPVQRERFRVAAQEISERNTAAGAKTSMGIRSHIWHDTALMIRERPLLGWGLGRYKDAHATIIARGPSVAAMAEPSTDPHNQFLRLWAEAGLPGLIAFLAVLWGAWRQRGPRPYAVAGLAILAAWCVNSLFSSHFWVFNEGHLIAVFMGVLLARAPVTPPVDPAGSRAVSVADAAVVQPASAPSASSTVASTSS